MKTSPLIKVNQLKQKFKKIDDICIEDILSFDETGYKRLHPEFNYLKGRNDLASEIRAILDIG